MLMKTLVKNKIALMLLGLLVTFHLGRAQAYDPFEKAASFRDEEQVPYDPMKYFNLAVIVSLDGKVLKNDSIEFYIRNTDDSNITMFYGHEKTDLFLKYDEAYEVVVKLKGYPHNYFRINTDAPKMKYGQFVNVNLEKGGLNYDVGVVVWERSLRNIQYYPSRHVIK